MTTISKIEWTALLERRAVVAFLLRLILRWCANFHRTAVHRTATDTTLKPKGKDGNKVRAILPRPERRGLSCTGSAGIPMASNEEKINCTGGETISYYVLPPGFGIAFSLEKAENVGG
jgi:hypothetical protein